jgi:hypothetical protein
VIVSYWILTGIYWAALPVGLYAFVHSLLQRADAYAAANRLSKPAWMAITAGGTLALALFSLASAGTMFWIAGLVAVLVYIVDVRPKINEVQRGQRW